LYIVTLGLALMAAALFVHAELQAQTTTCPPAADTAPETRAVPITSRTRVEDSRVVGEVVAGETVVLTLRDNTGGLSVGQRADIIARRLTNLLNQGYTWRDIRVDRVNNQQALLMGPNLLATVTPEEARLAGMSSSRLASTWQDIAQNALQQVEVQAVAGTEEQLGATPAATAWPAWTNPETKIVPIISLGTPGVRLGFAQVTGPEERVDPVRSVVQFDLVFERAARVRVFVPSTTLTGLNRVQGVAVTALLQYGLFEF
jgi:hypothetical protein